MGVLIVIFQNRNFLNFIMLLALLYRKSTLLWQCLNKNKKEICHSLKGKLSLFRTFIYIYNSIIHILKKEIKNKIKILFLIFNIPRRFKRFFALLTQDYQGDITISPNPQLNDYFDCTSHGITDLAR